MALALLLLASCAAAQQYNTWGSQTFTVDVPDNRVLFASTVCAPHYARFQQRCSSVMLP